MPILPRTTRSTEECLGWIPLTSPTEWRGSGICFNKAAHSPSCGSGTGAGGEVAEVTAGCGQGVMAMAWPQIYWLCPGLQLILSQGSCHADVFITKLSRQIQPASQWKWQQIQLPPLHGARSRMWFGEGGGKGGWDVVRQHGQLSCVVQEVSEISHLVYFSKNIHSEAEKEKSVSSQAGWHQQQKPGQQHSDHLLVNTNIWLKLCLKSPQEKNTSIFSEPLINEKLCSHTHPIQVHFSFILQK